MIAIIDYDIGNLKSVHKAFSFLGVPAKLTSSHQEISAAGGVVLPGVGAFGEGIKNLQQKNLDYLIKKIAARGVPLLGICLGMQLLFEESAETPGTAGLGILQGEVKKFSLSEVTKIPHMGWNQVCMQKKDPLFCGLSDRSNFYFVHSYYVQADEKDVIGKTRYGIRTFSSVIRSNNIWGFQCHPEKSSIFGLQVLKNFSEVIENGSNSGR